MRQFTADDLLAFARVFDVPVARFFLPPKDVDEVGAPSAVECVSGERLRALIETPARSTGGPMNPIELRGEARWQEKRAVILRTGKHPPGEEGLLGITLGAFRPPGYWEAEALKAEAMAEVLIEQAERLESRA